MLLFEHPVNRAREARGAALVNCVWVWGGGVWPSAPAAAKRRIYSDDGDLVALGTFAGAQVFPLANFALDDAPRDATTLVVATSGSSLDAIERAIASPAWNWLVSRAVRQVDLIATGGGGARVLRWQIRRLSWWRRLPGVATLPDLDVLLKQHHTDRDED